MAIVQMVKIAHHIKDGVEAVGDKVHVAIGGSQSDDNGNFVDALQAPSRSRLGNLPPLPWLLVDAHLFQGEFGAADFGVSASVNSNAAAIFAPASPPGGSVESLLQASSFPFTAIAPPLAVAAAARRPTHRKRHSVERRQLLVTSRLEPGYFFSRSWP
ncbi:hypothetical protein EDB85DRAFT_1181532 [Lactarius pseudohatsudake]|nr:hypothetical protein EDB85DRAFT_1181532 [Lactarius pseudohatsudake]